jgi:hypothetical protein
MSNPMSCGTPFCGWGKKSSAFTPQEQCLKSVTRTNGGFELRRRMRREPFDRKGVDAACRYWIENGIWPLMARKLSFFASDRIAQAHVFATWMHQSGFRVVDKKENKLLDFLLVSNWEAIGVFQRIAPKVLLPGRGCKDRQKDTLCQK